jgi:hypothetical protein
LCARCVGIGAGFVANDEARDHEKNEFEHCAQAIFIDALDQFVDSAQSLHAKNIREEFQQAVPTEIVAAARTAENRL